MKSGRQGYSTHSPLLFLNMSKQEASAGPSSPKESYTLERTKGLGNVLLRNRKEIGASKDLLGACVSTKKPGVWEAAPERKIQGGRNSTGSGIPILASDPSPAISSDPG